MRASIRIDVAGGLRRRFTPVCVSREFERLRGLPSPERSVDLTKSNYCASRSDSTKLPTGSCA